MPASRCLCGKLKDGYIHKTPGDGFSGNADIIWAEGLKMMKDKSSAGLPCADISCKLKTTAELEIYFVDRAKDKLFFTGLMMAGSFKK